MSSIKLQSEYDDLNKYEYDNGDIIYYKKDKVIIHNPYGPAIIGRDGFIGYWINGNRHRLDGPAMIRSNGEEIYFINGKSLNKEEFEVHPERLKFLGKEYLQCIV